MLHKRLETAFELTREEHGATFERFANAFLLPDYPELEGIGGKKDKGMDARIIEGESGANRIVVQSCVSPRSTARTKTLATVAKLEGHCFRRSSIAHPQPSAWLWMKQRKSFVRNTVF